MALSLSHLSICVCVCVCVCVCACACAGDVCVHACGEGHSLRDAGPGQGPAADPLGAAGLRRAVHLVQEVLHHLPDYSVCMFLGHTCI